MEFEDILQQINNTSGDNARKISQSITTTADTIIKVAPKREISWKATRLAAFMIQHGKLPDNYNPLDLLAVIPLLETLGVIQSISPYLGQTTVYEFILTDLGKDIQQKCDEWQIRNALSAWRRSDYIAYASLLISIASLVLTACWYISRSYKGS